MPARPRQVEAAAGCAEHPASNWRAALMSTKPMPAISHMDAEARRLGALLMARLDQLATFTSIPDGLTRLYLTPAHKAAALQVLAWMRDAGLQVEIDAIGNVVGRSHPITDSRPVLLLGSHIDTVRQAGRYDGNFGVLAAIAAVAEMRARGLELPFAVEIIAFGDEEGVRFPSTMAGSRAVAGCFDPTALSMVDKDGVSLRAALIAFGCDPDGIAAMPHGSARAAGPILGYIEAHIEQGPVLEAQNLPLGIVTAIAGAMRLRVTVNGTAGHAGTVPMWMRHDALVAAAGMVMAIEHVAGTRRGLVATVGELHVRPGTPNSIPGEVEFSIDIRAGDDAVRLQGAAAIQHAINRVASERGVRLQCEVVHEAPAVTCAPELQAGLERAVESVGIAPLHLASGAGHDAMMMARFCPIGMLFTRCWRGISHNPAEAVTVLDAGLTVLALCAYLQELRP